MRPIEFVRLLNSTPLAEVIDERHLRRLRDSAGLRIGDGSHIDLLRFMAWIRHHGGGFQPNQPTEKDYEAIKEQARARNEAIARAGRDIGELPRVLNLRRKNRAESDFRYFCLAYFPEIFLDPFCADHLKVIAKIEQAVLRGGLFAMAMPRGSGKTVLSVCACVWAVLYGHSQFVLLIGSSEPKALDLLESIKVDLRTNPRLLQDFPEVCYPVRKLGKITNRAAGQLYKNESTEIEWGAKEIVLPAIDGSKASGAIIQTTGLTGEIRGAHHKRPDGRVVRPSLVLLDDPQTDDSARSPMQCATREAIVAGAVLGLAGPGQPLSAVMPCTVIRPNDMADHLLDRTKHPAWNGERTKMVYSFPLDEKKWEEYRTIRADSFRNGGRGEPATAYLRKHFKAMHAGAVVAWESRKRKEELSALQHAMNLKFDNERAFFAEYQNEPLSEDTTASEVSAEFITSKINRHKTGLVPHGSTRITMFVDVQQLLLYWAVVAWEEEFGGHVLAYGTYPDQHAAYFSASNAKHTLALAHPGAGFEGTLFAGLTKLTETMLGLEWRGDEGSVFRIDRCLIDANWAKSKTVVYQFCRRSKYAAVVMPSHGHFWGASSIPMSEYKRKQGDRIGHYWRLPSVFGKQQTRYILWDTNYWKTFAIQRLAEPMGDPGCLDLYGDKPETHRMFADQLTSEYAVRTEARGRVVDEWKQRPDRENHWWDCVVGCAVGASLQGATLPGTQSRGGTQPQKLMTIAELRAQMIAEGVK